jgi:hypothetical protein
MIHAQLVYICIFLSRHATSLFLLAENEMPDQSFGVEIRVGG